MLQIRHRKFQNKKLNSDDVACFWESLVIFHWNSPFYCYLGLWSETKLLFLVGCFRLWLLNLPGAWLVAPQNSTKLNFYHNEKKFTKLLQFDNSKNHFLMRTIFQLAFIKFCLSNLFKWSPSNEEKRKKNQLLDFWQK